MPDKLFNRQWELLIDTLDVSALDFSFHVEKNTKAEPNKAEVRLYNLSPDHVSQITKRAKASKSTGVRVDISAGYADNMPLIFRGDAREIHTTHDGPDRITMIGAHDGGRTFRESRINKSFQPGASIQSAIQACASAMGIGAGNSNEISAGAQVNGVGSSFPNGMVLSGLASQQLTRITKAAGLTWSVQNGVLQLLKSGTPLQSSAVRIASDSGMIGSPTIDMDSSTPSSSGKQKKPPLLTVQTLMIAGLYPGRKVVMDTEEYKGGYMIVQANYVGDTSGNDWTITMKLRPY